ncbi:MULTISPECIES: copper resistance D family protein [Tsukamurella]|uniref:CopD family protein n=2 Tax=Tsukamurella TaxID=2060 RepID=A0A5C5S1D2_9ACTN|nr:MULTISPECIES: CopD family protein [Tsukamurella]NMD54590.1 CopD family protein [Tsukamurella columbiensis]TWS28510.1 CopD family protein [Tsukamurella conjunctivitidis]
MASLTYYLAAGAPATPPLWRILTQVGYFGALALSGGVFLVLAFLLPVAARGGAAERAVRGLVPYVAAVTLIAGYAQYAGRIARSKLGLSFTESLAPSRFGAYLDLPKEKGAWISAPVMATAQLGLFALAVALLVALRLVDGRAMAVLAGAGFAVIVLAASAPSLTTAVVGMDAAANRILKLAHILACVVWLGGLFVLAAAGLRARRSGADGAGAFARMWGRFSAWAMGAVIAVGVSGLWLTWVHVGSFAQFVTTPYGRYLLIKLLLVVGMVVAGAYNVRVLIPAIRRARLAGDGPTVIRLALHRFPRVVAAEAAAGIGVLLIVPFLSGSARKQADGAAAGPFDWETFGVGALLVVLLVVGCTAAVRVGSTRSAGAAGAPAS